jgi:predicted negative regulator of RcsB-dependent stress response
MTVEELAKGFCIGNSHVTKVEIPVFTVPNWLKVVGVIIVVGLAVLAFFGWQYYSKTQKGKKEAIAEINRLERLNQEQVIAQIAVEKKLDRYEPSKPK